MAARSLGNMFLVGNIAAAAAFDFTIPAALPACLKIHRVFFASLSERTNADPSSRATERQSIDFQ